MEKILALLSTHAEDLLGWHEAGWRGRVTCDSAASLGKPLAPAPARTPLAGAEACACAGSAEQGGVRPFGVSLLMAGHDTHGPQLYQIDPSGSYFAWKASAIGKNMTNAKTFLEKRYSEVGFASALQLSVRLWTQVLGCHGLDVEHASTRLPCVGVG